MPTQSWFNHAHNQSLRVSTPTRRVSLAVALVTATVAAVAVVANVDAAAQSSNVTVASWGDAYVSTGAPNTNYGTATILSASNQAGAATTSYVGFQVPSTPGLTVTKAQVILQRSGHRFKSTHITAARLDNFSQSETSLTQLNAPVGGSVIATDSVTAATNSVIFDVTAAIAHLDSVVFSFTSPLTTAALHFSARESGANGPQLILTTQPAATTAPTQTSIPSTSSQSTTAPATTAPATTAPTSTVAPTTTVPTTTVPTTTVPTTTVPTTTEPTTTPSTTPPGAQFVTRNGSTLMLGGKQFRYVGLNYYYATDRDNMPNGGYSAGYDNDVMNQDLTRLDQSIKNNNKVLRIWFFQRQATVNGKRDWAAFDHTLQVAAAHGYKVIAALTDEYDYSEGPFKDINFFKSGYMSTVWSTSTTDYLSYVRQVVARYADNPTIMAWQLINEGKADSDAQGSCPNEDAAFQALNGFVSTVSTAIHQLDGNHLISNGLLYNNCGTHAGTGHYAALSNLPYNDLYELHDYSSASVTMSADASYIFTAAAAADRPAIVGEAGIALSLGLPARALDYGAKFAAWWRLPVVAGITPWVWNGEPQLGTVDRIYDISAGDPVLAVLAQYGTPS